MPSLSRALALFALAAMLAGCATPGPSDAAAAGIDLPARVAQVRASEEAFARSMADRDFMAFGSFIADDAVFVNGGRPLRGKPAILAFWKRFFDVPNAPFSWKPEVTEVIARGDIGYTTGPVTSAAGSITAHFHSTWRLGPDGRWRIVFDNGYPACACER
jgi:ketosteroid isomerase-like protein